MIVIKFGGSSVKNGDGARRVVRVVKTAKSTGAAVLVVVSALELVTRLLVNLAEFIENGNKSEVNNRINSLIQLHRCLSISLGIPCGRAEQALQEFDDLRLLEPCGNPPRLKDKTLAAGELASSRLYAEILAWFGIHAEWIDPRQVIVTDGVHGAANPDMSITRSRVQSLILPRIRQGVVLVTGGFVGATIHGATTTLGFDGSDRSAVILGVSVNASEVHKMTDVDGVMPLDPDGMPYGEVILALSYERASELALKARRKFLHPDAIRMAKEYGVPIRVRSTLNPAHPGTLIGSTD